MVQFGRKKLTYSEKSFFLLRS